MPGITICQALSCTLQTNYQHITSKHMPVYNQYNYAKHDNDDHSFVNNYDIVSYYTE